LARLIQNGFTGEAKAGEARKTGFFRLLVYFNPGLQNGFTLQCLDLRKIDEAEADISRAKEALSLSGLFLTVLNNLTYVLIVSFFLYFSSNFQILDD